MIKIFNIYDSLSESEKINFISSCAAKQRNLFGVPRLVINQINRLSPNQVLDFITKDVSFFKDIDSKYFPIINSDELDLFNNNFIVIFDLCKLSFLYEDEFFNYLNNDLKKIYNLQFRHDEKNKFLISNNSYLNDDSIISKVIQSKLDNIWRSRWGFGESYLNNEDHLIISNLNYE